MLMPLRHHDWQVLRAVARSRKPVPGRSLRLNMARNTHGGEFLSGLVRAGLLAAEPLRDANPNDPPAFRLAYTLTPAGKHAAEYGEYEVDLETFRQASRPPEPAKRARKK